MVLDAKTGVSSDKKLALPKGINIFDFNQADIDGMPLKLTSHEFRLLAYLMHHMGEVVSRTELIEHLYDQDFDRDSNTIEVFVGRLRKKMGIDMIETVRGMGYRMREPEA